MKTSFECTCTANLLKANTVKFSLICSSVLDFSPIIQNFACHFAPIIPIILLA